MRIDLNIPQSWDQLSDKQLFQLCLLLNSDVKGITFDWKCFTILVAPKLSKIITFCKLIIIKANVKIDEIKPHIRFVFDSNTRTRFPAIKNNYFSPLEKITNLTIAEMAIADDLHIKWRNTRNIEYLKYLAATLYVHQQQPRPSFDKNDLTEKVNHFQNLSVGELLAIEITFHGCKEYLATKFKTVFPKPKKENNTKQKPQTASSLPDLILSLSGGKFGTHAETSKTNVYTFFSEFEKLLKEK